MTGNGHIMTVSAAARAPARQTFARVENARQTSVLYDRSAQRDSEDDTCHLRMPVTGPSQSDTGDCVPLWHGPRLRPAFVAQILGQVLTHASRCDPHSIFAAYEDGMRPAPRAALDCKI